jgi:hypothetical protein
VPFGVGRKQPKPPGQPVYLDLRGRVLGLDPAEVGIQPTPDLPHIWAILADIGIGGGVATIVAFADGTTSLYTSVGGGMIGSGSVPAVRATNQALLRICEAHLEAFARSATDSPPGDGEVSFVVLTYDGPRRASATIKGLFDSNHPLSAAWSAANEVMTQLRLAQEAAPPARAMRPPG